MTVKNQSRDLIGFVRDERLFEEDGEWKVGERHLRRNPFDGRAGRDTRKFVTGARWRSLRQQILQAVEGIGRSVQDVPQQHEDASRRTSGWRKSTNDRLLRPAGAQTSKCRGNPIY